MLQNSKLKQPRSTLNFGAKDVFPVMSKNSGGFSGFDLNKKKTPRMRGITQFTKSLATFHPSGLSVVNIL